MANKFIIQKAHWNSDQVQLINVRTQVFVEEQQVPRDIEIDGKDAECSHVKALNLDGEVIGTARLLPTNYIGRMCVLKAYRHLGIGAEMLSYFINYARQNHIPSLRLNAQISAIAFYQKYGFICDSEVFIEADIEHIHMTLSLAD
ncbi:MAG: GNAT family N-acetyltransferase [Gammaproteobacteria bacterium]|jgi:predicted GNAT family N-acyltransferase|nr:GNAT family N-acetyltransferase [Gammaproteobacteria bacterium]MBT3723415.1 GNAT family N-acetyltransferase [Gammaproteobacteria bacterium]MBT4077656.1 GNAT family N-acetyltransferase [Gammaproteobacteria bacterium]MBT4196339.1 GNAT family N-acetyltransferase [Gammaproteobacteria bacterium]MBT4452399.1 GNAT family N-acetyltransferase [Gammaproteobacteria bacterium]